jgi:hypothetical protein
MARCTRCHKKEKPLHKRKGMVFCKKCLNELLKLGKLDK